MPTAGLVHRAAHAPDGTEGSVEHDRALERALSSSLYFKLVRRLRR